MVTQSADPGAPNGNGEPRAAGKIRILFLGSNPTGLPRMALDQEVRQIKQQLRGTPGADRFELLEESAVRLGDLQGALQRHRPHILHFSGHGQGRAFGADPTGAVHRDVVPSPEHAIPDGELFVQDEHGRPVGISASALSDLLDLVGTVRCVVLNACYSAAQCEALRQQADCVIGMARAIPDDTAIAFAGAFYQALGFSVSIQAAFGFGCNQLDLGKLPGAELPQLVAREGRDPSKIFLLGQPGSEIAVGDPTLDRTMTGLVSNVRDAMAIEDEVFRSVIRRKCQRLLARSAIWKQGRLMVRFPDYNNLLIELYKSARRAVFSTSVPEYLSTWEGPLGETLLRAHRESAARVTRVFVFDRREQVTPDAYRIFRQHRERQIDVRLFFDDEVKEFALRGNKDFTIVDERILGLTMKFSREAAAEWHFLNEEIIPEYQQQQQQLLQYSVSLDAFAGWWSTRVTKHD